MALRTGLRWWVITASAVALALATAAMTVALVATAGIRADGRELSQRLVPMAAGAVGLLKDYQAQQNWLRGYVTAGRPGSLSVFDDDNARARARQDQLARLARGYPEAGPGARRHRRGLPGLASPRCRSSAGGRGPW